MLWTKCILGVPYQRFTVVLGAPSLLRKMCSSVRAVQKVNELLSVDIKMMENIWQQDAHSGNISKFLYERFSEEKNCYTYALNLLELTPNQTSELAFEIIYTFRNWINQNTVTEILTADLKFRALETVLYRRHNNLHSVVFDVFQLQKHDSDFEVILEKLISKRKFIEVANYIMLLGVQKNYPLEKIVLPLVLSRQMPVVLKYLHGHPDLQEKLVKLLDDLLARLHSNPNETIQGKKLNPSVLYQHVNTIINNFELSFDLCPNANRIRIGGTLNMLVRKKIQKSISEKAWEENVMYIVQNDMRLQKNLIQKLVDHSDFKTALKIAMKLNIPQNEWPPVLLQDVDGQELCSVEGEQETNTSAIQETENDYSSQHQDYLTLELDPSNIHYVTTSEGFFKCLKSISEPGAIVGIDSEWKPFFMQRSSRLSLIQLAVGNQVYILDLLALKDCVLKEHWDCFMTQFLANPDVLKLGCGIVQDIQMLVEDYQGSKGKTIRFSHVLDVSILFQKMAVLYVDEHSDFDIVDTNLKGLSRLCSIILGKPLNKVERACDWEQRPLSDTQITYAALDAYCLLQMFKSMQEYARKKGEDFCQYSEPAISGTTFASKMAARSKHNVKWMHTGKHAFSFKPSVAIQNFKVVVDSQLTNLGLKLRKYGVDVIIEDASNIYKNNFKVVLEEGRTLVGSSVFREKVKGVLPEEKYFIVAQVNQDGKDIVSNVVQHFNLHLSVKAINSRCMKCNADHFQEITSDELLEIVHDDAQGSAKQKFQSSNSLENSEPLDVPHEYSEDSSATVMLYEKIRITAKALSPDVLSKRSVFKVCTNCAELIPQR